TRSRLALAGVSATLGTIHLIAAARVECLAAGAHHALAVHLSHVLATLARFVFGFLPPFLPSAGHGRLQALDEAVVHAKQPLERPSARDLVAGLTTFVSAVQIRRSTNRPTLSCGPGVVPPKTAKRGFVLGRGDPRGARVNPGMG